MEPIASNGKKPLIALEVAEYSTLNKGHILWLFGYPIAIKEFMQSVLFFVIVVLAFNFGYTGNGQVIAVASQLCTEGVYDHTTGLWTKCYPTQSEATGTTIFWSCVNNSEPFSNPFPENATHNYGYGG